jgi:CubicO group peptidase (beta-lactamase class C family)
MPRNGARACGYLERYSLINLLKPWLIDRNLVGDPIGRWVGLREFHADGPAYGGVIGTANSFARFLQYQLREQSALLGPEARSLMQSQQSAGGARIPMTLGWHMGTLQRMPYLYKEGGGGGFRCLMRLYRDAGLGTVVMTNATSFNVTQWLDRADAALLRSA